MILLNMKLKMNNFKHNEKLIKVINYLKIKFINLNLT